MKNKLKKIILIFLVNFGILFSLLLFGELVLRFIKPNMHLYQRTYPGMITSDIPIITNKKVIWPKIDKDLGWVCKNINSIEFTNLKLNNYTTHYKINKEGFRNKSNFSDFKVDSNSILMLGDSFLFGVYLNDENTISSLLSNKLNNTQIFNLGIPGYGIDQMYLSFKKYCQTLSSKVVILLYVDDDIIRTVESFRILERMHKPSFELVDGKLSLRTSEKRSPLENIFENSFLFNKFYLRYSELQSIELTKVIVKELNKLVNIQNKKLIIFRCPSGDQIISKGNYNRFSLKQFFYDEKIDFFDIEETFKNETQKTIKDLYLPNDGHLSAKGTDFVSSYIANVINDYR